jgi:hypothetical protein
MKTALRGKACQGHGVPGASPVVARGVSGMVVGGFRGVAYARLCRRAGCSWGPQAGCRRDPPA